MNWKNNARKGAYIAQDCDGKPDVVVLATGSEVNLALAAVKKASGKKVRIVSVFSRRLFLNQDQSFRKNLIPDGARVVVVEAARSFGWEGFASSPADLLTIDDFGASGPAEKVAEHFGFTADNLAAIISR